MTDFDPKKALSDKTFWYPDGLFNDHGVFTLQSDQNASVMRYVWHGCLLPTTVEDYARTLAIPASDLPGETETELKEIVGVFVDMKQSSTVFRDVTWPSMVAIVDTVFNYASRAGGKDAGSYYFNMLDWVRQYNKESLKDNPDPDTLEDLKESIMGACKKQENDIDALKLQSEKIKTALGSFKSACVEHENRLNPIIQTIQEKLGTLDGDTGKIAEEAKDIKQKKKLLDQEIKEYDKDVVIAATTPSYAWLGLIGCVAAITVASIYGDKARRLEKAIKELKAAIEKEQGELKAMIALEAHFTSVQTHITGLHDEIDGAIQDLGKHEGVWESIKGRLTGLRKFVADLETDVEPTLLEKVDLENIVEQWNNLAKSGMFLFNYGFSCLIPSS
ncbi:uncharacterized protein ACLA_055940 [Aspergillus clavatus NRRL 1]|uniref:Uncharacterized protein n=1 Tax=Aspergillus clavatus (strain ATCC 1007 / CBS 513.65 / DSM 816 / NCTC 3887 / NRRL 1 / QM 1276 / 107) TaxID=344612 RepID=A1C9M2_ASPCL|nr:uncharacterized protein ACLA_055940 [Aspergillus clavatus NRRL 1]EAW13546.1 conserved hypothetical protein [Aspergillus clavatus NRRL 1]